MFTGIIQAIGQIQTIDTMREDITLNIQAPDLNLSDVKIGDSIAVNGICLTAIALDNTQFQAQVSKETLKVTVGLDRIQKVNLEKALRLSDRLGGHLVSGHVDGVGVVARFEPVGESWLLAVAAPHEISKYIAQKGSICINGVSLTVNNVAQDQFTVNIIPHTLSHTTLRDLKIGDAVNLEIDQIARYVERMTAWKSESL